MSEARIAGSEERQQARALLLELLGVPRLTLAELQARADIVRWDVLIEDAGLELQPMLGFRIAERGLVAPPAVVSQLTFARRSGAVLLARRRSEMRRVFAALGNAGISFTVLKGLALAHRVYPSPELRMMGDVDLWLDVPSLRPAMAALEPLGWYLPWWHRTHAEFSGDGRFVGLMLGDAIQQLELHKCPASLADAIPESCDAMWQRRVACRLHDLDTHVLCDEDMIIHLSLHLARHHKFVGALSAILDLALLVASVAPSLAWDALAARCLELGIGGYVGTSLAASARMLGAPVPAHALAAFGIPDLDWLAELAAVQAFQRPTVVGFHGDSVLGAPDTGALLARFANRLKGAFIRTEDSRETIRARTLRTWFRIRYAGEIFVPAMLRAALRGTFRAQEVSQLRQLSTENHVLAEAMSRAGRAAGHATFTCETSE